MVRTSIALASLIAISIIIAIYPARISEAQVNWISSYSIRDLTDNRDLASGEPLIAGHSYRIAMTIQVPDTLQGVTFTINLYRDMNATAPAAQIWIVESEGYQGFDRAAFRPAEHSVVFNRIQGTLRISATFQVPQNFNIVSSYGGVVIREPKDNIPVIYIVSGGSTVGNINLRIVDSVIQTYETLYKERSNLIPSGSVDRAYEPLINSLLSQASSLASQGLYDQAISLLRSVDPRSLPQPPSGTIVIALGGAAGALAAAAAALFVMLSRARASRDDALEKIRQARNRVAGIKVRAQKLDRVLAQEIEDIEKLLGD